MWCGRGGREPAPSVFGLSILGALALLAAGCGSTHRAAPPPTTTAHVTTAPVVLRVGVVGPLRVSVPGVAVHRGRLAALAGRPFVLADARVTTLAHVAASARAHPASHFALVGASARTEGLPNLTGVVLDQAQAAYLAGVTAGAAAMDEAGSGARVVWAGPEERALARAFSRGVRASAPGVAVLHQWSQSVPARCKEAALTGIDRGGVVVFAHHGLCADAAASAAHEQNLPALRLGDFLRPSVAAAAVVREAASGIFHGGQDVVFGAASGAIGVRSIDPRISPQALAQARSAAEDLAGGVASGG